MSTISGAPAGEATRAAEARVSGRASGPAGDHVARTLGDFIGRAGRGARGSQLADRSFMTERVEQEIPKAARRLLRRSDGLLPRDGGQHARSEQLAVAERALRRGG